MPLHRVSIADIEPEITRLEQLGDTILQVTFPPNLGQALILTARGSSGPRVERQLTEVERKVQLAHFRARIS